MPTTAAHAVAFTFRLIIPSPLNLIIFTLIRIRHDQIAVPRSSPSSGTTGHRGLWECRGRLAHRRSTVELLPRRGEFHLPTQVDLLTQERDQLKAELARERDNAAWLKGRVEATQRQLTDERGRSWWQRTFGGSK